MINAVGGKVWPLWSRYPDRENAMRSMSWSSNRANEIVYISKYVCTIYVEEHQAPSPQPRMNMHKPP